MERPPDGPSSPTVGTGTGTKSVFSLSLSHRSLKAPLCLSHSVAVSVFPCCSSCNERTEENEMEAFLSASLRALSFLVAMTEATMADQVELESKIDLAAAEALGSFIGTFWLPR